MPSHSLHSYCSWTMAVDVFCNCQLPPRLSATRSPCEEETRGQTDWSKADLLSGSVSAFPTVDKCCTGLDQCTLV